ncbi:MAG TPA: hypothetical protein VJM13_15095, partial [Sphingopyxis sp.]|nr:hypothetical protein [Sphingopyxis sp.]
MLHDSHWARALARAIGLDHPGRSKAGRALLGWARTRASQFGLTEKEIDRAMLLAGPQTAPEGAVEDDSLAKAN